MCIGLLCDAVRCAGAAVLWQETGMLECRGSVSAVNADVLCSKDDSELAFVAPIFSRNRNPLDIHFYPNI